VIKVSRPRYLPPCFAVLLLAEDFVHNGEARAREGQRGAVKYFLAAFPDLEHESC
jgi:hypothetical protein